MADLDDLVGQSPAIEAVRGQLRRLLGLARERHRLPAILIQGETGTGKGLVARLLHRRGPRARGPFVDLNCAAIPETLLEGELFGYERGAFTDARHAKPGLLQASSGGVLFLDEIALLPLALQAKLLTAIDDRAVRRLGSTTRESFDAWIISATNADLEHAVRERRFREDLYHRLAVVTVRLPPLRERGADVALLAERFLAQACRDYDVPGKALSPGARALLGRHAWPGNVRELANAMERLALLVDGDEVGAADLETGLPAARTAGSEPMAAGDRERLLAALEATGWNIMRTAARLGVSRNTVRARMDRLGLRARRETEAAPAPAEVQPSRAPGPAPTSPPGAATVRWERQHVTLLRVQASRGPGGAGGEDRALSLASGKVLGFGGRVEGLGRGALTASFGVVPVDNAARRAVGAALAIEKAVAGSTSPDAALSLAVHTAQVSIAQTHEASIIDAADLPRLAGALDRLLEGARPGTVLVSQATAPFVERHFELQPHEISGAPAAFLVGRRDPTGVGGWRRLSRFVGREAEMDLLRRRWELARSGRGQIVGLVGEAGAGKSRLLLEFVRTLDPGAARVLRLGLSATEDAARRRPAAALVGSIFDTDPAEGSAEVRERIAARLADLGLEATLLPPLAALVEVEVDDPMWAGLDSSQRARRMLDALRRLVVRESLACPLVLVLEDLHWVDADTQVAVDALIDVVATAAILALLAYRPEYRHGWTEKGFYTQLRVDPLPAPATGALLDDLLGASPELGPLKRQLAQWTEGNPFFLEEGVRELAETGVLAGAPGAFRMTGEVRAQLLPATVEDTLASRIHRLPPDVRHVLQCAAAIGTDVARAVLEPVAGLSPATLDGALRALEDAEFVYARAGATEPAHTFRHALTHLVAYRSLPAEAQRALHGRILAILETVAPSAPDAQVEALAEHAVRGEVWAKAVTHLRQAGTRALARSANRTAADYLERALAALERADPSAAPSPEAVDIRLELRHALTPLGEAERILGHLREAEAVAARLGDERRLGRVISLETNSLFSLGDHAGAIACGQRALDIARRLDDRPMAIAAEQFVGRALHAQGRYREAAEIFRRIVDGLGGARATESLGLPVPPAIFSRSHLVSCLAELGEFEEALRLGEETVRLAEQTGQPEALQWAGYPLGLAALDRGDLDTAAGVLDRVLSVCLAAELPVYLPRTRAALAHARVLLGQADALPALEEAVAEAERRRQVNVHTSALVRLADAYVHAGRTEDALRAAERAVALARERGERGTEARALRVLSAAHARAHAMAPALTEACYRAALDAAEALEMRPLMVLCWQGLGLLLGATRRVSEAHDLLIRAEAEGRSLGMQRAADGASHGLAALAGRTAQPGAAGPASADDGAGA